MSHPGEPSSWKVEHYANVGTSELFVFRFAIEIPQILEASLIMGKERDEAKEAITTFLLEGLTPAFEHLRTIRKHASEPPPELNRRQAYEDFIRTLWHAYKDLLKIAVRRLGFDIGFLFQNDQNFEKGLQSFLKDHPEVNPELGDYLKHERSQWQNELGRLRNDYLEHRKLDWEHVKSAYRVDIAERLFQSVWTTSEDIFVCLVHSRFPDHSGIVEIPESKRDHNYPLRYQFVLVNMRLPES
jgi:hypothetical protein